MELAGGSRPRPLEQFHLTVSADERRRRDRTLGRRRGGGASEPGGHRCLLALCVDRLDGLVGDRACARGLSLLTDHDTGRRSRGLQPGRAVHGVPHDRELAPAAWAHGREDHLSRVDTDADAQPAEVLSLCRRALLDLKRGADRPLGVVLVGHRGPEHRHQRIADDLVDRAAEPLDDLTHLAHAAVDHGPHLLRVGALRERREARQIGEHDGHPAPLAFDALAAARRWRRARVAGGTACPAEAKSRRVLLTARGARVAESDSAVAAEALRGVVEETAGGAAGRPCQRPVPTRAAGECSLDHVRRHVPDATPSTSPGPDPAAVLRVNHHMCAGGDA